MSKAIHRCERLLEEAVVKLDAHSGCTRNAVELGAYKACFWEFVRDWRPIARGLREAGASEQVIYSFVQRYLSASARAQRELKLFRLRNWDDDTERDPAENGRKAGPLPSRGAIRRRPEAPQGAPSP